MSFWAGFDTVFRSCPPLEGVGGGQEKYLNDSPLQGSGRGVNVFR